MQEPFVPPGEKPKKAPRTKQTARCTGRGGAVGSRVTEAPPASVTPERKPQMARRGGHYPDYPAPRRGPPGYSDGTTEMYPWFNEPSSPDKKSESPCSPGPFAYDDINGDAMDEDEMDEDEMDQDDVDHDEMNDVGPAARLGLINGRYEVYEEPRDETSPPDTLILTLDGHSIWGYYEMQNLKGMFYMHGRPYTPDEGNRATHCRSRVANGAQLRFYDYRAFAPCQYLNLLGGGWLRGAVRHGYGHHDYRQFTAKRVSGGETRSEISPLEMRRRWEEFIPRDLVNSLGRQQPENRNRGW
ncbi:hypothetical protein IMZ48_48065 [Candidatus Bathyarchaeota archaeon]|nr:hypothetical protein [Candidatus Bathyarchaeota archaeon]